MKIKVHGSVFYCVLLASVLLPCFAARADTGASALSKAAAAYGQLPLAFEINEGQSDPSVKFLCRGEGYGLYLTGSDTVLALIRVEAGEKTFAPKGAAAASQESASVLRFKLLGTKGQPQVEGEELLPGKSNYFIGSDPKLWRTNVPQYARVKSDQVYPGIDLVYYGRQRQLEYDFQVGPGADPGAIRFAIQGARTANLDPHGDLVLQTPAGEVIEQKPLVYQEVHGKRERIGGGYEVHRLATADSKRDADIAVSFRLAAYDRARPLIIDPVLAYATYLGGGGNGASGDGGSSIAVDGSGNAYVTGYTYSINFPTTTGAFQVASSGTTGGVAAAFVTKLNPTGTALVYSTYLSGTSTAVSLRGGVAGTYSSSIAVDGSGNAYVTGYTSSLGYPTTTGAYQASLPIGLSTGTNYNGYNYAVFVSAAFVTKLNPAGTGLLYSTLLGGTNSSYVGLIILLQEFKETSEASVATNSGEGIAVDGSGSAYVTGNTSSSDFPTTPGAFQAALSSTTSTFGLVPLNAFVTKLNPTGTGLIYSTYLGGTDSSITKVLRTGGTGIAVDSSGNAFVTGYTNSTGFPTTSGAFQAASGGSNPNAFVAKLNPTGMALVYSTYLGGSGNINGNGDQGSGIALDAAGNAYVTGFASSPDFPTTPGAFQTNLGGALGGLLPSNAFVSKLNPSGTQLIYSTFLGGSGDIDATNNGDQGLGIAVDGSGDAYVTGLAESPDFPATAGAIQTSLGMEGAVSTNVTGISGSNICGDFSDINGNSHGFILSGTTYTAVDNPNAVPPSGIGNYGGTYVTGIQGSNVVGNYAGEDGFSHGFILTGTTYTTLDDPNATGFPQEGLGGTFVTGIDGSNIVGYYVDSAGEYEGFIYNGTTYRPVDEPNARGTTAEGDMGTFVTGIDGSDIVGYFIAPNGNSYGFIYNGTTYTTIVAPDGTAGTYITGISGTNIIGYYIDVIGLDNGFVYNGSTYTVVNNPNGVNGTSLTGISGGNVVGNYSDVNDNSTGFVLSGTTFTTLYYPSLSGNAFVTKLNPAGTGILYSTYLGGGAGDFADGEQGNGIALDGSGNAYVTGYALSPDFPTTPGADQPALSGTFADAFVAELAIGGTAANVSAYAVMPGAGPNGGISPNTTQVVTSGSGVSFTAVPNIGYTISQWLVNGTAAQNGGGAFTLNNVTAGVSVEVTFVAQNYTVMPTSGPDGSISQNNAQIIVGSGSSIAFTATPNIGYAVSQWLVNGTDAQNGGNSFTLNNVVANTSVEVTFTTQTYSITPIAGTNGSISPDFAGIVVASGSSIAFTATPDSGYMVSQWLVNGTTAQNGGNSFTLNNIVADSSVEVTFTAQNSAQTFTVTPSAGANGSISPNFAQIVVASGSSIGFTATPDTGYMVSQWLVDGTAAQNGGDIFTLNNIVADASVEVTFTAQSSTQTYTVTPSAGSNGSISPNNVPIVVASGSSIAFTATPDTGYMVSQWLVDGTPAQNGGNTFALNNIVADSSVEVTFTVQIATQTFTVTPSAGANGNINTTTPVVVNNGASASFTATPAPEYGVSQWLVNGILAQTGGTNFTLSDVTADSAVQVTFAPGQFFFAAQTTIVHNTDGQATVAVTRDFSGPATVAFATVDESANAGVQYTGTQGTLSFAANQTQATITVQLSVANSSASNKDFSILLSSPSSPTVVGSPGTAEIVILNAQAGDLTLSQTGPTLPSAPLPATGSITVSLFPSGIGQWRLFGELSWRNSGGVATGLTAGSYEVEFETAQGYQQPAEMVVAVTAGDESIVSRTYTVTGSPSTGSLEVNLAPKGTGGWRFQGETAWRLGGQTVTGLNTGDYILEFEPVTGLATPEDCEAVVVAGQTATVNITYALGDSTEGLTPVLVSDTVAQTQPPYVFTGQIQTDEGLGTGFVPLDRVVVTAAHVLFDDSTLSFVTGVRWFFQYESGTYEAPAQIPTGSYVLSGYAAQRALDNSPGVASTASRELDAAALYFLEPAARGGQSGYLGSNSEDNPWLTAEQDKFIAGYPVTGVTPTGFLYATPTVQAPFQFVTGSLFSTTAITSFPGNSGGPVFVRYSDGNFYPAAIYLGGSQETIVHAIDSQVVALITQAETSGNGGQNNSGGGIIQVSEGLSGNLTYALGNVKVTLLPAGAVSQGAYWEIGDQVKRNSGQSAIGLTPGSYPLQLLGASPGYTAPAAGSVSVTAGNETDVTATYTANPPTITSGSEATAIEGQPFSYQAAVIPSTADFPATYTIASGVLPSGLSLNGTTGLISGTVPIGTTAGIDDVSLVATNSQGPGNPLPLALTVAEPGKLTVIISGKGTISKGFADPTIHAVNSSITIKATPAHGYLFAYWSDADTGAVLSTKESYTFTVPALLDLEANFVADPFLTAAGSYVTLVEGNTYSDSGFAQLTVARTGGFTATFNIGGTSAKVRNAFNDQSQYQGSFTLPGNRMFDAALSITAGGMLTGTLTSQNDGTQIALSAERTAPHSDQALAGAYTVQLPAVSGTGPDGNGYGTLTISKTGAVRFAGKLGDGLPVTLAGSLDSNGAWPFLFVKAAGKKEGAELVLGSITFPPGTSGNAGELTWYRTANNEDTAYPAGFSVTVPFIAGSYKAPAVSSGSASITFSGADLTGPVVKSVSISSNDKVTYTGADKFSLSFTAHNGLFSGKFSDNGTARPFTGAVLQSGSSGVGLFEEKSGQTGSVLIAPSP